MSDPTSAATTGAPGLSVAADKPTRRPLPASLIVGAVLVGLVIVTALVSFAWTPHPPTATDTAHRLLPSSGEFVLGTDRYGRDVASQLMAGARVTLLVGVIAVGVACLIGVPLGIAAGLSTSWPGSLLMRALDLLLAFPALLLAIMFGAAFGVGTVTGMVAIGVATIPSFARVARSGTLQVRRTEYVLAAQAAGRGRWWIAVKHVLPNTASLVIVQASVSFAIAILAEAALSYLGLGTQPPTPSWGRLMQESQDLLPIAPTLVLWPGIAIVIAVLGFNLLGDGLRDRLDPRLEDVG